MYQFLTLPLCLLAFAISPTLTSPQPLKPATTRPARFISAVACAAAIAASPLAALAGRMEASSYMDRGMQAFRTGDVTQSVALFNLAEQEYPELADFLWQRGLSLYFANDFKGCSAQFRRDVRFNPSDTEEAVWAVLCESHLDGGMPLAQKNMMTLQGGDRRPIMREIEAAYRSGDTGTLTHAADDTSSEVSQFYANLYLALYMDATDDKTSAKMYASKASASAYSLRSNDYMVAVAKTLVNRLR